MGTCICRLQLSRWESKSACESLSVGANLPIEGMALVAKVIVNDAGAAGNRGPVPGSVPRRCSSKRTPSQVKAALLVPRSGAEDSHAWE